MFNQSKFTESGIRHYYQLDPTKFVYEVLEGLASGQIPPEAFQFRPLAEALMSRDWVDGNMRPPKGARGVPYDGETVNPFNEQGEGGEFSTRNRPNEAAVNGFAYQGQPNKTLLESFAESRKAFSKTALLESGVVRHQDFTNITGQILFTAVYKPYTMREFEFTRRIPSRQSDILDVEKVMGTTSIGNVFDEPIKEGDPYPSFGVLENFRHAPPKEKRGGLVKVTKEAVRGNRTGDLLSQCQTIGKGLGAYTENAGIFAVVDEGTKAKSALQGGHRFHWKNSSFATYQSSGAPWTNVVTSNGLVNEQSLDRARQAFLAHLDPFTNEEIEIAPKEILVHYSNELQARKIVAALQVRSGDITSGDGIQTIANNVIIEMMKGLEVVSTPRFSHRIALSTDWWMTNISELLERIYVWDLTSENFSGGTYEDIHHDVVQIFKVSKMDCYSVVEPRAGQENRA